MRITRRVAIILSLAGSVFLVWWMISRTPWAATVDAIGAGERFTTALDPVRMVAGTLLVTVPAVLLVRSGWSWLTRTVLGREQKRRVPDLH